MRTNWPAVAAAVPVALAVRLTILVIGYVAVVTIGFPSDVTFMKGNPLWELPQRWDAGWYLGVARDGYQWNGDIASQQNLNFFPAYPMLVRVVSSLVHVRGIPVDAEVAWTATLVSIAAFAAASAYIYRIAADRFGADVGSAAVVLIACYPFAVFFSAVYSEALFLLCAVGAWYHLERHERLPLACWGLLAGLCRPNGLLLAAALGVWVLVERRRERSLYALALMPIVGTLVYSAWAYSFTGHVFVWAELQRSAWLRTYQGLDHTIWEPISSIVAMGPAGYFRVRPWTFINLAPTLLALVAIWPVTRRLGLAMGVFVAINVLVPLLNGGLVGMGRYTSVLFPVFIWLALAVRRNGLPLLAAFFAMAQGVAAVLFFTWRQIF
jgi:hypothetical protein